MKGELPEIFWYLFWIGFVILAFRMAYLGGKSGYDTKMRALDILKMYAEKGTEPPPAVMEELTRQAFEHNTPARKDASGNLFGGFIGFLFTACAAWALRTWLISIDAPAWASISATAAWAFFGFGAFGFLVAALIHRQK